MADQPVKAEWLDEVTIEISGPRNANAVFGPERLTLRGEWRKDRLFPDEASSDEIKFLPPIFPGVRISIDGRTKTGRIWDPLSLPENAHLLEQVSASGVARGAVKQRYGPVPEISRKLNDSGLKTWLYHVGRLVGDGMASIVSGRPPREELRQRLSGKTEIECYRESRTKRYLEDRIEEPETAA